MIFKIFKSQSIDSLNSYHRQQSMVCLRALFYSLTSLSPSAKPYCGTQSFTFLPFFGIFRYLVTLKVPILSILWMVVNGNNIARREVKTQIKARKSPLLIKIQLFIKTQIFSIKLSGLFNLININRILLRISELLYSHTHTYTQL